MMIRVWVTGDDGWLCIDTWRLRSNLGLMLNNVVVLLRLTIHMQTYDSSWALKPFVCVLSHILRRVAVVNVSLWLGQTRSY